MALILPPSTLGLRTGVNAALPHAEAILYRLGHNVIDRVSPHIMYGGEVMSLCVPGDDLVLTAAAIAISISKDLNADDTSILAGLFTAIGDNLAIIAAKKQTCSE